LKKKLVLGAVLATVMATGTAFASPVHPDGLGIGILWGGNAGWGRNSSFNAGNVALSLKLPAVPVFWGINLGFGNHWFSIGVQGDVYILGSELLPTLSWFLGLGGYVNFTTGTGNYNDWAHIGLGARLPIGLTWQPVSIFELFLNLAPSLGIHIHTRGDGNVGLGGGIGGELGLRVWL